LGDNASQPVPMSADDQITPAVRAARLLDRGPVPVPRRSWPERVRALLRRGLLLAARPQARYQREIDDAIVAGLRHADTELALLRERYTEQTEYLEDLIRELILTAESLRRAVLDVDASSAPVRRAAEELTEELKALPYMAGSPFERLQSPVGEVLGFSSRLQPDGSSDYVAFEELFRGPADRVTESQRPYLALVRDHAPVLDVGCGRGEFLALLAEEGIAASGIDSDPGMVKRCQALGVDAALADANEHLEALQDGTLGTVFSAQVVEHLPLAELQRMLELARRKLRPGGLFIAETVNPHCISSLKTFWVDLTHQHPIFPEVALAMCAIAGFESAYVFAPGFDSYEHARFESSAYAVVATAQ
ncbi:MAG: class I SAM-dependent methyltransferase, partial [Solirubrobacteraceae bacterium]